MEGWVLWPTEPDQLQALNPLLIILLIPVFERLVYPLLHRFRIPNRPLQRMVAGMTFSILAFCVAGLIQIKIDVYNFRAEERHRRSPHLA
nr:hypothetical protein BaRGS_023131 [Batillaria attramentaria]